jgi:hypothetical protein
MQYNEYYGSAYNFEVGYLEALRTQLGELIREQLASVKKELPEE